MKKLLGTALILITTLFIGHSQQDNNNDDVYYNDPQPTQINQPQSPDQSYQNYDDDNNNDAGSPTYQTFYDQLSPYGSWVNYPGYGYCWVPYQTDPNFSPYMTGGHWVYTDLGWTWVSDYAWGWAAFHYGRWFLDATFGWMWVPGYDWGPAWCMWGDYDGYYGWACIGPHEVLSPHYRPNPRHWHFVEHQFMGRPDVGQHVVHNEVVAHDINDINHHVNIISHANTYNQSVFFSGPKASEVEKYTGTQVQHVQINNVHGPQQTKVNGNQVNIYRPNIIRNDQQHATPNKIVNTNDLKPANRADDNNNRGNQQVQPQRNTPLNPDRPQQQNQNWTPPRQSPVTQPQQQQRQNVAPTPQPQRQFNTPSPQPVQRTFIPSQQPVMQQQHYSAPAQQPHFSPSPAPSRGGGGGRR